MDKPKDGFWVRMWMRSSRGTDEETYEYILYESGYTETDEVSLKSMVDDWCNNDMEGWAKEHYRYGYEIVSAPPVLWLETQLNRLESKQKEITKEKERIEVLLHENNGEANHG